MTGILILLFILVVASLIAGGYLFHMALYAKGDKSRVLRAPHNKVDAEPETREQEQRATAAWCAATEGRSLHITGEDGTPLHGQAFLCPEGCGQWVIVCHGYGAEGRSMLGTARYFWQQGYHVLVPDCRGAGGSGGQIIGMGWPDRRDMVCWIKALLRDHGSRIQIALYGISMGGATVMMTAGEEDLPAQVKAVIEDCGYTSLWAELAYQLKKLYGLPPFPVLYVASLMNRLRAGYFLGQGSAVRQVAKAKAPILFIHGAADTFVPAAMMEQLYAACTAEKQRLLVPEAGHGGAWGRSPEAYHAAVTAFLGRYMHP